VSRATREAVRGGSPLGLEAKRYMEQGLLVPDDVVIGIVAERLDAADCQGGFLLDGFPRTVAQAKALDALLARRGQPLGSVLLIALPREAALERLAGRRVCEQCGAMFHSSFDPPAQADRCDRCGAQAYLRVVLMSGGELLFCAHHGRKFEPELKKIAAEIQDETERLTATPASASERSGKV